MATKTTTLSATAQQLKPGDKITHNGGIPLVVKQVLTYFSPGGGSVPSRNHIGLDIEGLGMILVSKNTSYEVTRETEVREFPVGTVVATSTTIWRRTDYGWRSTYLLTDNQQDNSGDLTDATIERWLADDTYGVKLIHKPFADI